MRSYITIDFQNNIFLNGREVVYFLTLAANQQLFNGHNTNKRGLLRTNIIPQPLTYIQVSQFLINEMGIQIQASSYEILAAFAIVGQLQKIKNVLNTDDVSTETRLQSVMRHIGEQFSKEAFLQEVLRQSQKWREAPQRLKTKIGQVKIAYRMYKKYRSLFQDLSQKYTQLNQQFQVNLMSIFWVVYLFLKNAGLTATNNTLDCIKILKCLFKFIFREVISQIYQFVLLQNFQKHFNSSEPIQISFYQNYRTKILDILKSIHHQERGCDNFNLQKMIKDQIIMVRFLDDIDNNYNYNKNKNQLLVDQLSFNQLLKVLTPFPLIKQPEIMLDTLQKLQFKPDQDMDNHSDQDREDDSDSSWFEERNQKVVPIKKKEEKSQSSKSKKQQQTSNKMEYHEVKYNKDRKTLKNSVIFLKTKPLNKTSGQTKFRYRQRLLICMKKFDFRDANESKEMVEENVSEQIQTPCQSSVNHSVNQIPSLNKLEKS